MNRPAFKITAGAPGSDVAGTTVAALASGYTIFKDKGTHLLLVNINGDVKSRWIINLTFSIS